MDTAECAEDLGNPAARAEIVVLSMTGDMVACVKVQHGDSIAAVRKEIHKATGIPPVRQCLLHGETAVSSNEEVSTIANGLVGGRAVLTLTTLSFDGMIEAILNLRGTDSHALAELPAEWLFALCDAVEEVFLHEPVMLDITAPVKVASHISGDLDSLLKFFEHCGLPPASKYLLLGNYSRPYGRLREIELLVLLLAYKVTYPDHIWLLRGKRECASISRVHGFYDVVKRRYCIKLWKRFMRVFNCMPLCALVGERILCMSGGISPELLDFNQIRCLARPADVPDSGLACDLLWSDPDPEIKGWDENDRGVSFIFGPDVVTKFVQKHGLDLIIRGHNPVQDGYEFFADDKLLTLISAVNYMGEFQNAGAIASIDTALHVSFVVMR